MEEVNSNSTSKLPKWFVKLCKWLWKKQSLLWITVILGIALNLFAAWLFTPSSIDYKKLPIWWVLQNPIIILFVASDAIPNSV